MTALPQLTADMPIADVPGLPTRVRNALLNDDPPPYRTVRDLAMAPDVDLLRLPNFGKASLRDLRLVIPTWIETPIRPQRCDRCRFWDGRCRRRAPVAGHLDTGVWPTTAAAEWCGDFKSRAPTEAIP